MIDLCNERSLQKESTARTNLNGAPDERPTQKPLLVNPPQNTYVTVYQPLISQNPSPPFESTLE